MCADTRCAALAACCEQKTNRMAFTHCEIHPAMILGVCASIIPFPGECRK
jgi:hypothetical protein